MIHVLPAILFFLLDTPQSLWQVCIMSNAEGCNNIGNDFLSHQLDLQGLFRALNVRPRKHIVQCDQVKGACNVTPVWAPA